MNNSIMSRLNELLIDVCVFILCLPLAAVLAFSTGFFVWTMLGVIFGGWK